MMGFGFGFGFLGMVLFWGAFLLLLIGGAVVLFRQINRSDLPSSSSTARRLLDERLARGEIGPEEYDRIRLQIER